MRQNSLLFRKYVRTLVICMGGLSFAVGLIHMIVLAEAQKAGVASLLKAQTQAASEQIQGFLGSTVASLRWIDDLDEPGTPVDYDAIHNAGYRLLRRAPSIIGLAFFDGRGCKRLSISRLQPDTRVDCREVGETEPSPLFLQVRAQGLIYGPVFFPDGSEPHMYLGLASRGNGTGALVAEINLKVIHDTVAAIRVGASGFGFVVDQDGRVIAHPDETLVLRQSRLPPSFAADKNADLAFATDFAGQRVVTTTRDIEGSTWRIILEQPASEALAPVYTALWTTGALVVAAILGSLLAGYLLAGRLARPLSQLRDGAAKIAQGDLSTQLTVSRDDEIGQLAEEFNRMARALADSRADLEAKVVHRTSQLQTTAQQVQKQATELSDLNSALAGSLREAQRRKDDAERANAAKSRFLAVASHDLRQPMHAISLLVGLLSEKVHATEHGHIVEKVQGSVDAMEGLFNTLLDISKLDAGAVTPNVEEFPIEALLDRVKVSFESVAAHKGLSLQIDSCPALIRSDAALLERILFNLVSNGIRYTRRGGVRVECTRLEEILQLSVIDTGVGIPTEYHERIYDEFFQISTPAKDRSVGLGLGLSIVKQCADLLALKLSMHSSAAGSCFQIDVPCVGTLSEARHLTSSVSEISERLATSFVVVIDDDFNSRFATEETYRQWGCRVLAAESVEQALEQLAGHLRTPDLIITDFQLGAGVVGLAAIEAVRTRAESAIPAIIVTGEIGVVSSALVDKTCVVLQKPVGSERLKEVSERVLGCVTMYESAHQEATP
jgi:signal transduction histidine kinase/CheY-like chemotaxis protein